MHGGTQAASICGKAPNHSQVEQMERAFVRWRTSSQVVQMGRAFVRWRTSRGPSIREKVHKQPHGAHGARVCEVVVHKQEAFMRREHDW
eukprot:1160912-Pelagomonas_calceolata.AAC.6